MIYIQTNVPVSYFSHFYIIIDICCLFGSLLLFWFGFSLSFHLNWLDTIRLHLIWSRLRECSRRRVVPRVIGWTCFLSLYDRVGVAGSTGFILRKWCYINDNFCCTHTHTHNTTKTTTPTLNVRNLWNRFLMCYCSRPPPGPYTACKRLCVLAWAQKKTEGRHFQLGAS